MKPGMQGRDVIKMATQIVPNFSHHLKIPEHGGRVEAPPYNTETEKDHISSVRGAAMLRLHRLAQHCTERHLTPTRTYSFSTGEKRTQAEHPALPAPWNAFWEAHVCLNLIRIIGKICEA